jgi:catechol 2,3-dioxygenase-like lactoylglutathione lyase family enzyme
MPMIDADEAFSGFAAPDLAAIKAFYGGVLGLPVDDEGVLWIGIGGGKRVLVYPKADHEPATYTILNPHSHPRPPWSSRSAESPSRRPLHRSCRIRHPSGAR